MIFDRRQLTTRNKINRETKRQRRHTHRQQRQNNKSDDFYIDLYGLKRETDIRKQKLKTKTVNVNLKDMPPIDEEEIRLAVQQIKNRKAVGDDDIITEMRKTGNSSPLINEHTKHFNKCLQLGDVAQDRTNAIAVIIPQKGN